MHDRAKSVGDFQNRVADRGDLYWNFLLEGRGATTNFSSPPFPAL